MHTQIAGIVGKYVEYPFDTIKVRLQSQPTGQPSVYSGPLDCVRKSLAHDGFMSLYRGISAPLFGAALENSSLFLSVSEFIRPPLCRYDHSAYALVSIDCFNRPFKAQSTLVTTRCP